MDRAPRHYYPWPAKAVVLGHDREVEFAAADPGVLDLRCDGAPAARAPDRQCRHHRIAPASDHVVGPGRLQASTGTPRRIERRGPQQRRQTGPWKTDFKSLLDKSETGSLG